MDKEKTLALIKDLSNAPGAPGFEDEVVACIRRHSEGLGEVREDTMRNLYLCRSQGQSGKPLVMLDAHSDEVSFMVRSIRPNGTLSFIALGGWLAANVGAHRVLVKNRQGKWLPGIVATKPPHFLSEADKNKAPDISSMVIDVGASSAKEIQEDYQISMGAPVVPDVSFAYDAQHDIMIGKAFDDRLGCAAVIATLKELSGSSLNVNITAAFSTQEEAGLRGAQVTAQTVKPNLAIVLEGSPADDTVVDGSEIQTAIRKGPMLRHFDARMITNPRFQRFALDTAHEKNIPVQEAVRTGGSTNGGVIHLAGKAVPVLVIGMPVRYIHTHYGIAAYSDFENSVKLACQLIQRLDETVISGF